MFFLVSVLFLLTEAISQKTKILQIIFTRYRFGNLVGFLSKESKGVERVFDCRLAERVAHPDAMFAKPFLVVGRKV